MGLQQYASDVLWIVISNTCSKAKLLSNPTTATREDCLWKDRNATGLKFAFWVTRARSTTREMRWWLCCDGTERKNNQFLMLWLLLLYQYCDGPTLLVLIWLQLKKERRQIENSREGNLFYTPKAVICSGVLQKTIHPVRSSLLSWPLV